VPPDFDRKTEGASCCGKICATSADSPIVIREFPTKHETTAVPQQSYSPDLALRTFSFSELEIITKSSAISDGIADRRKFDTELSRLPTKHVPAHVPEL